MSVREEVGDHLRRGCEGLGRGGVFTRAEDGAGPQSKASWRWAHACRCFKGVVPFSCPLPPPVVQLLGGQRHRAQRHLLAGHAAGGRGGWGGSSLGTQV